MSFTNKTPNYELPQWLADDKPTFLSDLNGAFSDIDIAMKNNANAAASAQSTADANTLSINGITTDLDGAGGVKARLSAVETAESNLEGSVNTINSLIGNGTPTTTDQTIIGAINEIHAFTGEGPLDTTAQTVTGAINELAAGGNVGALDDLSDVTITNPQSGDALVFNGTDWVNQAGGAGSGNLSYTGKHTITVNADGVKTVQELLKELCDEYIAYINAKDEHYLYSIVSIYDSITFSLPGNGALMTKALASQSPRAFTMDGPGLFGYCRISTTLGSNVSYTIAVAQAGNTLTDNHATVPTNDKFVSITLDEFTY